MRVKKRNLYVSIVVESNDHGFLARCPGVQGGFAEGDTIEESVFNCVDVVKMIFAFRKERKDQLAIEEFEFSSNTRITVSMPVGIE